MNYNFLGFIYAINKKKESLGLLGCSCKNNFHMYFLNSSSELGIIGSQIEIKWIFGVIMNLQQLKLGIEILNH
jgi:hypothetical protein